MRLLADENLKNHMVKPAGIPSLAANEFPLRMSRIQKTKKQHQPA
jgi:hypothetical protein